MTIISISPLHGWAGIISALSDASPGDVVKLLPGVYKGQETLVLKSGTTLFGEDGATLIYSGDGNIIQAQNANNITVEGVQIDTSEGWRDENLDDAPLSAIAFTHCASVEIRNCHLSLQKRRGNGIYLSDCSDTEILYNAVSGFDSGVTTENATGTIRKNEFQNCRIGIGILGRQGRVTDQKDSLLQVHANCCHGNKDHGIVSFSADAVIEDNECWANERSGIALQRNPDDPDIEFACTVRANRCHDNWHAGIVSYSVDAMIEKNECWRNEHSGILLRLDANHPEIAFDCAVRDNFCHHNKGAGIASHSPYALIEGNVSSNNELCGIELQQTTNHPRITFKVRDNRCHHNKSCGIGSVSVKALIEKNQCWGNEQSGIIVQTHTDYPEIASDCTVRANFCHHNKECGIVSLSAHAMIEDNECLNNTFGILFHRHEAHPQLAFMCIARFNRCAQNRQAGIMSFSTDAHIEGNECWDNGVHGITLERDPKYAHIVTNCVVITNRCSRNSHSGIATFSENAEIEHNECWDNLIGGIAAVGQKKSIQRDFNCQIRGNRCFSNIIGIECQSVAAQIDENECWDNSVCGIYLGHDGRILDINAKGAVYGNQCYQNQVAGIACVSFSADIRNNTVFGSDICSIQIQSDKRKIINEVWINIFGNNLRHPTRNLMLPNSPPGWQITRNENDERGDWSDDDVAPRIKSICIPLLASDRIDALRIANFVSGPSGDKAFGLVWDRPDLEQGHLDIAVSETADAQDAGFHFGLESKGGSIFAIERKRKADAIETVQARIEDVIRHSGPFRSNSAVEIALVSPDERDIGSISAFLEQAVFDPESDETGFQTRKARIRTVRMSGEELPPGRTSFDDLLLSGKGKWSERFAIWVGTWWISLPIFAGVAFAALPIEDMGDVRSWLASRVSDYRGDADYFSLRFASILATPVTVSFLLLNLALPECLRFKLPFLSWIRTLNQGFVDRPISWAFGLLERMTGAEKRWRKWAARRFYGEGTTTALLIRNLETWHPSDLEALKWLIQDRPSDHSLAIVYHFLDRSWVRGNIIDNFDGRIEARNIEIVLADQEERVALKKSWELDAVAADESQAALSAELGLATGGMNPRSFVEDFWNENWGLFNLLPVAVIASAPASRFVVEKQSVADFSKVREAFASEVHGYLNLFQSIGSQGVHRDGPDIDPETASTFIKCASNAHALEMRVVRRGNRTYERVLGRTGHRVEAARHLRQLWPTTEPNVPSFDCFLNYAIACGIFQNLNVLKKKLPVSIRNFPADRQKDHIIRINQRLRAISFLQRDISIAPCEILSFPDVKSAFVEVGNLIEIEDFSSKGWSAADQTHNFGLYLAATGCSNHAGLMHDIRSLLQVLRTDGRHTSNAPPPLSCREIFVDYVASLYLEALGLERFSAEQWLGTQLNILSYGWNETLKAELSLLTRETVEACPSLVGLLKAASSTGELISAIRRNHLMPSRLIRALFSIAVRYTSHLERERDLDGAVALRKLHAQKLIDFRKSALSTDKDALLHASDLSELARSPEAGYLVATTLAAGTLDEIMLDILLSERSSCDRTAADVPGIIYRLEHLLGKKQDMSIK